MIEPFHFGPDQQLFGVFHPPRSGTRNRTAVLLAYPLGMEYDLSHRAFVKLAEMLAEDGFPVLRFDFRGCGDSAGSFEDCSITNWLTDLHLACEELRSGSGAEEMCLLGLRLGASLAFLYAAEQADVDALVLWAPVVNGRAYSRELEKKHQLWLRQENLVPDSVEFPDSSIESEYLGFLQTGTMAAQLDNLDLLKASSSYPRKTLLLDPRPDSGGLKPLAEHIEQSGSAPTVLPVGEGPFWFSPEVVVPVSDLKVVANWMSEYCR